MRVEYSCAACGVIGTTWKANPQRYCSRACFAEGQQRRARRNFWRRVQKTPTCWLWTGRRDKGGYPKTVMEGIERGHRYVYAITYGHPGDACVLHRCDVRHCVRPEHLFLGTNDDTRADMVAKGRAPRGERNGGARLKEADVESIRARYHFRRVTMPMLAAEYGIHWRTVWDIVRGHTWRHLPMTPAGATLPVQGRLALPGPDQPLDPQANSPSVA